VTDIGNRQWRILAVVLTGSFMAVLDTGDDRQPDSRNQPEQESTDAQRLARVSQR